MKLIRYWKTIHHAFHLQSTMKLADQEARNLAAKYFPQTTGKETFGRNRQYVRFFSILADGFSVLRGYPLSGAEYESFLLLALCGPLFDDFFDKDLVPSDVIMRVTRGEFEPLVTIHKELDLYTILVGEIEKRMTHKEKFIQTVDNLCRAQIGATSLETRDQPNEILKWTYLKGGLTALLCRLMIQNPLKPGEEQMVLQLGYLAQIMDDLFDWNEDLKAGRNTSFSAFDSMKGLKLFFLSEMNNFKNRLNSLDYPGSTRTIFLNRVTLAMAAFMVAWKYFYRMDPYSLKPGKIDGNLPVCDMEKPMNQLRLIWNAVNEY